MLYRDWVFTTAAAVLLAFTPSVYGQAFPSSDGLMSIPDSSGWESARTVMSQAAISGNVYGERNSPIGDAKIEIRNLQSGRTTAYGYTSPSGGFELSDLPPGYYDVIATSGLSETHEQVRMEGSPVQLTLRLSRDPNPTAKGSSTVSVQQLRIPNKAQNALEKAQDYFNKGKLDQAREQLAKALSADPTYSDAFALRGIMALHDGNTEAAISDLDHAIQTDHNNAMAYVAMGSAYNQKSQFDDAQRELEMAESLNPALWQTHFELAKAKLGKGDHAAAMQEANRAQTLLGPRPFGPMEALRGQITAGMKASANAGIELQKPLNEDKDNSAVSGDRDLTEQNKPSADSTN